MLSKMLKQVFRVQTPLCGYPGHGKVGIPSHVFHFPQERVHSVGGYVVIREREAPSAGLAENVRTFLNRERADLTLLLAQDFLPPFRQYCPL